MSQKQEYAAVIGAVTTQQAEMLLTADPKSDEALHIVQGAGGDMAPGQYALVQEENEAGEVTPKHYIDVSAQDLGTRIEEHQTARLKLPELGIAAKVIEEQRTDRLEKRLGDLPETSGKERDAQIDAKLRERTPQPPLTQGDINRISSQRGQAMTQEDIDGINAARARGLHL